MRKKNERRSPYVAQRVFGDNFFPRDKDFQMETTEAELAIKGSINPILIPEGSSGSYFLQDRTNSRTVAVFKPKCEEPFALLNPKWPKFLQRICCFCCFGRACLISNHGYLSETAASLVDEKFGLSIVPKTRIAWLASSALNYGEIGTSKDGEKAVRAKAGSLQLFVRDYQPSYHWIEKWATEPLPDEMKHRYVVLFQKLVVLDYIIRNTDRHFDNWLIKYESENNELELAAIDNGLAFPFKHPEASRWRKFPFEWVQLKEAKIPFYPEVRHLVLPKLNDIGFVTNLTLELRTLLEHARTEHDYNARLTNGQMAVFCGQLWNLRESLAADESPLQLTQRRPVLASRRSRRTLYNLFHRSSTSRTEKSTRSAEASDALDWSKAFRIKPVNVASSGRCYG